MSLNPQTERTGRFSDSQKGAGIGSGLRSINSLPDTFTRKDIKRNLKPFKKFGVPQNIQKFGKKSDTQLENIAANAIVKQGIKRGSIKRRKVRTTVNRNRFTKRQIVSARKIMAQDSPRQKALKRTREARRHIRTIRRNREIVKKPLFSRNV